MQPTSAIAVESRSLARRDIRWTGAIIAGILAAAWFMFLSGWLGVMPGHLIAVRQNVLFDSDMNLWVDRMITDQRSYEQAIHPLELVFWRYPCRALAHLARLFWPRDYASLLGTRFFVAMFAGAGVGGLFFLALHLRVSRAKCVLLFLSYMLFTSNLTIALPEHFGISNGLLCLAFVIYIVMANERLKEALLGALALLCGGTSIPNVLFPAYCLFDTVVKSARLKFWLLLAAIPAGLGTSVLLYRINGTIHRFFSDMATFRFPNHPIQALIYTIYMVAAPMVGPIPFLRTKWYYMVTYETLPNPMDFSHYYGIQGIGALLWLGFLARCVHAAWQDEVTRKYTQVALGWMLYNFIFYNVWGREYMLFAPAWSWTLMALVILGARHLPLRFIAVVLLPIAICQIVTLNEIRNLVFTVTDPKYPGY